jgi:hypothetical protein
VVQKSTTIDELKRKVYNAFTTKEHQERHPYGNREVVRIVPYSAGGPCPFPSGELLPFSRDGSLPKKLVLQIGNGKLGSRTLEELGVFDKSVNYLYFCFCFKGQSGCPLRSLLSLIERGPGEPLKNECKCHSVFVDDAQSFKRAAKKIKGARLLSLLTKVVDRTPLRDRPEYEKYRKKESYLPQSAVRASMQIDGVSQALIDAYFAGAWRAEKTEKEKAEETAKAIAEARRRAEEAAKAARPITERTKMLMRNREENDRM